ncbi:MAG: hypothetical protein JSV90_02390 [Methanobacteriota archaeon]|nr:MAG: hypothetical protein JSV90_02390 [Euryarchaeota archaeon]
MNKVFVKIAVSSEGESPKRLVERMKRIGALPLVGDFDFELSLNPDERLFDKIELIHRALKGSRVSYTVTTLSDVSRPLEGDTATRPIAPLVDLKPPEVKKEVYKAKIQRWKEMGLDVSELEGLLDTDLERFKEASKDFLRTHLTSVQVVSDKHPQDSHLDGQVLALLGEPGRTIDEIAEATGYPEDQVTISLGRLISAGSARRFQDDGVEKYALIPPPAPPVKRLRLLPAEDEEELEDRILNAISPGGCTRDQIFKATRLPDDQVSAGLASLSKKGRIRVKGKGKKARFTLSS